MPAEGEIRDGSGAGFELIETMRWEPVFGFIFLERHLARLYASARELSFACDPDVINKALATVTGKGALRVRLLLAPNGAATVTTQTFDPWEDRTKVWTLRVAETRLDVTDPLLRHKTTRRDRYQKARAEFSTGEADEVILLNGRGEVCEGTITNIFVDTGDGVLLTPALSCGLLPGVFRAELLARGQAREAVMVPADLMNARRLFVGNSLRGLILARMGE